MSTSREEVSAVEAIAKDLNEQGYKFVREENVTLSFSGHLQPFWCHKITEGTLIIMFWHMGRLKVYRRSRKVGSHIHTTFQEKWFDLSHPDSLDHIKASVDEFNQIRKHEC